MKSIKKLVLGGLVLLASVMVLVGCKNDSVPEVPHEHTFAEEWNHNGTHHWKDATCGHEAKSGYAEHTFGEYVSNNDATTEKDGTKTRTCSVCGKKETVTEEEIRSVIKHKLYKKNILFQEQAIKLMTRKADGSTQKASEIVRRVCEFAQFHIDNVISTYATLEAIRQFEE